MQKKQTRKTRSHIAEVRTAAQFDALASPVRDQIVQVVVNQAPWSPEMAEAQGVSIREIARQLGRRPASLYRHIDALVEVGLIRQTGTSPSGGRDASTYSAIGEVLHLVTPDRPGPAMDSLCRYIQRMASHAGKENAAATRERGRAARGSRADSWHDESGSVSMFGWLDEQQRERLRRLMFEVAQVFEDAARRPGTRLIAASVLVRPVRLPGNRTGEEPGVSRNRGGSANQ